MTVMSDAALQAAPATKARGYWATVGRRIARDKVAMACAFVLALIFLSALFAPWLGLADPYQGSMIRRLRHIGTPNYPLGTDELGRDMLARLIYGGRLSLIIGILPVILAFMIGTSLGLVAGYVGGKLNTAIMRTIDVFYAFPSVLLAIAISGSLGAGIPPQSSVWPPGTAPLPPLPWSGRGRRPKLMRRDNEHQPVSVKALALGLPPASWQTISWREASAGALTSRFARV